MNIKINMTRAYFHILRVGLAIVFLWIAVLIFKSPGNWATLIQPQLARLLPFDLKTVMITTAVLDAITGFLLLLDVGVWLVAIYAALHIATALIVVGINEITVRDIGLLTVAIALFLDSLPANIKSKIIKN